MLGPVGSSLDDIPTRLGPALRVHSHHIISVYLAVQRVPRPGSERDIVVVAFVATATVVLVCAAHLWLGRLTTGYMMIAHNVKQHYADWSTSTFVATITHDSKVRGSFTYTDVHPKTHISHVFSLCV